MTSNRFLRQASALCLALMGFAGLAGSAHAQQPGPAPAADGARQPLRLVVPFPPGGTVDGLARILSEKLQPQFPAGVVVENRPGANGNIGAEGVFRAPPDGSTLLVSPSGPIAVNQSLYRRLNYDPARWVPVTMLAEVPNVLAVHPSLPARNVAEFVAYLKANPGKVSFASQGSGSSSHLAAVMFMELTGTEMIHVPYKGTGPALTDLIGGQVNVFFDNLSSSAKFAQGGKLRILAVADNERSRRLPEVPTFAESGVPALKPMASSAWYAVVAPPGTPAATVQRLEKAIGEVLAQPDVQRKFAESGVEPAPASSAKAAAYIKDETAKWAKVIREAKVTVD